MNVLFDKEKYVKGRSLESEHPDSIEEGDMVKRVIRDSIAQGRVGSLTVDPQFLDFEPITGMALSLPIKYEGIESHFLSTFRLCRQFRSRRIVHHKISQILPII